MYKVIKRDGTESEFDIKKISKAIEKAFNSQHKNTHSSIIDMLALRVTSDFEKKIINDQIAVEDIQDSVEDVLSQAGYSDVAKAYILYRKQREKVRNVNNTLSQYKGLISGYVEDNKHLEYSVGGLIQTNSGAITRNYWLSEIYDGEIEKAHNEGYIHIHDLNILSGDQAVWSLEKIIKEGIRGIKGRVNIGSAKHLISLCHQLSDFIIIVQNEWAGHLVFTSFDTYLAPFIKVDQLNEKEVKNCLESFVNSINIPSLYGIKPPHTYLSMDIKVPDTMKDKQAIVGGKTLDFTYGDCVEEMNMIHKALLELLNEGDSEQQPFEYPMIYYPINHISDFKYKELLMKIGNNRNNILFNNQSLFYESIGSISLCLDKIKVEDEESFLSILKQRVELIIRAMSVKKDVISKLLNEDLYPYTKAYMEDHTFYGVLSIKGYDLFIQENKWVNSNKYLSTITHYIKALIKDQCLYIEYDHEYVDDIFEMADLLNEINVDISTLSIKIEEKNIDYQLLLDLLNKIQKKYFYIHCIRFV